MDGLELHGTAGDGWLVGDGSLNVATCRHYRRPTAPAGLRRRRGGCFLLGSNVALSINGKGQTCDVGVPTGEIGNVGSRHAHIPVGSSRCEYVATPRCW